MKSFLLLALTVLSLTAQAATVECASAWDGDKTPQGSLTFKLNAAGLPASMISRFNTAVAEIPVAAQMVTDLEGVKYMYVGFNLGTPKAIQLKYAVDYTVKPDGARLFIKKGSISDFPRVTPETTIIINGYHYSLVNKMIPQMACHLRN